MAGAAGQCHGQDGVSPGLAGSRGRDLEHEAKGDRRVICMYSSRKSGGEGRERGCSWVDL